MLDSIIFYLFSALFFLTPLAMTSITSELFEFNKMILIYILTVCIAFFWTIKMIRLKTIILQKTLLDIPLLIFFSVFTISLFFSIDFHTSLFGYYGRFNGGWLSILSYIVLYYAFVSNINVSNLYKLLKTSVFSSFLVILWGLPGKLGYDMTCLLFAGQWNNACWTDQFHPEVRMFSTLGQPNWLGAYLAINLFIGLFFLFKSLYVNNKKKIEQKGYVSGKSERKKINWAILMWYGYTILNFSCILFTRSRSAIVAVLMGIAGLLIALFFIHVKKKKTKQYGLLVSLWLIILFVPLILFKTGIEKIDSKLTLPNFNKQLSTNNQPIPSAQEDKTILITESFDIRKIVWAGALELGKKYPFFGTGPETFAYSYYFVRPIAHNYVSEWDYLYNKAHNEFLNYLATTGYIGITAYLSVIVIFFYWVLKSVIIYLRKSNKVLKEEDNKEITTNYIYTICLAFGYLSILITNFFGFSTTTINLFFFLIPAFLFIKDKNRLNNNKAIKFQVYTNSQIISITVMSLILLLMLFSIARYWIADILYAKADMYVKTGDYQAAANLLFQALELKHEHVYEDKLSYTLANLAVLASSQKKDIVLNQLINESVKYNDRSLKSSPKNILYWKTKAKNYYLFYQISLKDNELNSGIEALKEASKYAPTDPKIPYSLAVFYSLMYDDAKQNKDFFKEASLQSINKCLALKSDYRDGYFLKGQLLKKYNMKNEAKKVFQYIIDKINKNDTDTLKELQGI